MGTGLSTGTGITSIITADTSTAFTVVSTGDGPVGELVVQQAPALGENEHVLHKFPHGHEYRPGCTNNTVDWLIGNITN